MQACILFTASPPSPEKFAAITALCQLYELEQSQMLSDDQMLSNNRSSCIAARCTISRPIDLSTLRKQAAQHQIDVNQIDFEAKPKKLLIADMDATIIRGESLDELAVLAGIGEEISQITTRAMAGELDFEEALAARLALLKGQPVSLLDRVAANTQITPGAKELVKTMRANGAACYLISGGFTFLTSVIAEKLGFTGHHANEIAIEQGKLAGYAEPPILGKQAKYDFLSQYIEQMQITPSDSLCVGDGANDMMMLQAAGMGVAFEGKPALRKAIETQISHSDLTALLYLQGYSHDTICY